MTVDRERKARSASRSMAGRRQQARTTDGVSHMADRLPEPRPANHLPFDFHHEKVALTRMAHWLPEQGWEARLSVSPENASPNAE